MDPQQAQHMGSAVAGFIGIMILFGLACYLFFIFLFWRICVKAGLSGAMSLLLLIPGLGQLILLCILAFGDWKVTPILESPYYAPPPPPSYPPAPTYPPPPPTQL
jgi:hypothetical protein